MEHTINIFEQEIITKGITLLSGRLNSYEQNNLYREIEDSLLEDMHFYPFPEDSIHPKFQIKKARDMVDKMHSLKTKMKLIIYSNSPFFIESLRHYTSEDVEIGTANFYFINEKLEIQHCSKFDNDIGVIFEDLGECLDQFI